MTLLWRLTIYRSDCVRCLTIFAGLKAAKHPSELPCLLSNKARALATSPSNRSEEAIHMRAGRVTWLAAILLFVSFSLTLDKQPAHQTTRKVIAVRLRRVLSSRLPPYDYLLTHEGRAGDGVALPLSLCLSLSSRTVLSVAKNANLTRTKNNIDPPPIPVADPPSI